MIVLDTTVLVYAVGDVHPLRLPCTRLLEAHGSGLIEATTTIEVIQEFAHIRSQRRPHADAVRLAMSYMRAFELLVTTADDLERGLDLFERHGRVGSFDAVLAAVALNRGATALVSADRSFASIPDLMWIDPGAPALDQLLVGGSASGPG